MTQIKHADLLRRQAYIDGAWWARIAARASRLPIPPMAA
jgi:hypothetical protein